MTFSAESGTSNVATGISFTAAVVMMVISGVIVITTIMLSIVISLLCVRYQQKTAPPTSKHALILALQY